MSTPTARPRFRHDLFAVALGLLALIRAGSGDWLWAGVLAAGAATELVVWRLDRPDRPAAPRAPGAPTARPADDVVARSLAHHRRTAHVWTAVLVLALAVAATLLTTDPGVAAVVATLGVAALLMRRRSTRTADRLAALADAPVTRPDVQPDTQPDTATRRTRTP